jgi:cell division protein FtsQ
MAEPWIESARVKRRLPNALTIEIAERRPVAVVSLRGLYLAEADGRLFKRAATERGEGRGLPIITGLHRDSYLAAPRAIEDSIRAALAVGAMYANRPDRPAVGEIHVDRRHGFTLRTHATALAVRLGRGPAPILRERLRAFDAAWGALDDDERATVRSIRVDNVTHPDRVTVAFGSDDRQPRRMQ